MNSVNYMDGVHARKNYLVQLERHTRDIGLTLQTDSAMRLLHL